MKKIKIPSNLKYIQSEESCVVNLRLRNGRIIRDVLCWRDMHVEGTVVGGRDGVVETDFDFVMEEIAEIKQQSIADTFFPTRVLKERTHSL